MNKCKASLCALLVVFGVAHFVSASAQTCATPGPNDLYVDKDNPGASDSNNGHYTSAGGSGPFKTIQHLVDVIQPGQCGFVRQSKTPYYENTYRIGDYSGVTFTHSGTSSTNQIVVAGYPGEHPVIDQQAATAAGGSAGLSGFVIYGGVSYITIRNFEVRDTTGSGIVSDADTTAPTSYITIDGVHVDSLPGTGNPNNRGGVRLDFCHYCVVQNSVINNIGSDFGSDGVNAFQPGACIIQNNLIYNVYLGVQLKQADEGHLDANIVRNNIFVNIGMAVYKMQVQGAANLAAPHNAQFYNNVVYNARQGVWADLSEAGEQATSLQIYNNTFINTGELAQLSNFSGVQIYNNIYSGWQNTWSSSQFFIFSTYAPGPWQNSISYFNHNLYDGMSAQWQLEMYNNPKTYSGLASWRTATGDVTDPDVSSSMSAPLFVSNSVSATSLEAADVSGLALSGASPALNMGRSGGPIGAVRPGVVVGPQLGPEPDPPSQLSVQ